jgi:two-component sensor histidine kinase
VFVSHLQASYPPPGPLVSRVEADGIKLGLDEAVPCGLIVNELVTNALKYAFPDGKPGVPGAAVNEIVIRLSIVGATCILSVSDNGVGLRPDLDWKTTPSMGLRLVRMLGEHQLDGKIELDRSSGTRFTLTFDLRHRI